MLQQIITLDELQGKVIKDIKYCNYFRDLFILFEDNTFALFTTNVLNREGETELSLTTFTDLDIKEQIKLGIVEIK